MQSENVLQQYDISTLISNKSLMVLSLLVDFQTFLVFYLGLLHALQDILNNVNNWAPPVSPTPEELGDLAAACNKLWDLDVNRLVPDVDYAIDLQCGKKAYDQGDFAKNPLFAFVDEKALTRPTFAAFVSLLDNYIANVGASEVRVVD